MKRRGRKRLLTGALCLAMLFADVAPMNLQVVASKAGQKISVVNDDGNPMDGEMEVELENESSVQVGEEIQDGSVEAESDVDVQGNLSDGQDGTDKCEPVEEGESDSDDKSEPSEGDGSVGKEENQDDDGNTGDELTPSEDTDRGHTGDETYDGTAPDETESSEEVKEDNVTSVEEEPVEASGQCGDNLTWTLKDGTLTISGTGEMWDYSKEYDLGMSKYMTTAPWEAYIEVMTGLIINKGVTEIGKCAFCGCDFTGELTIPNSVTWIGDYAFSECGNFTGELTIPNSVTWIGDYAFSRCNNFTGSLTIPDSVTHVGQNAFYACYGFTGNLTISKGVKVISREAFCGCGFTGNLVIQEGVSSIGYKAFMNCIFTGDLTIPNSVTSIDDNAFYLCDFTGSLTISDSVKHIGRYAFHGCHFTGSLTISRNTYISDDAFSGCRGFTGNLVIPKGVAGISWNAFRDCRGFTGSLIIPDSMKGIGDWAFAGCSGLNGKIYIPESVTAIGDNAFGGISNLVIYGVSGSYAETYAKENGITFIPYQFNRPENTDVDLSNCANIYVVDSDLGTPVVGAKVNDRVADVNGYIALPVSEDGTDQYIGVTADGYVPYMSYKKLEKNGTYYISMTPTDGGFAVIYAKATIGGKETNLLADKIYLQHTGENVSGASGKTTMELEVKARGDIKSYTLIQGETVITSNSEGKFSLSLLPGNGDNFLTNLAAQKSVGVRATDVDGQTTVRQIGIYISPEGAADIKEEDKSGSLSVGSKVSATLPDSVPFLGGSTLSYGLENPLPFDVKIERDGQVKIAVNKSASESMEAFKEDYNKLSQKAKNLSRTFDGTPHSFGGGMFSAKVSVKGYGEGYIDMTKPGTFEIKVGVIVTGKGSAKYTQYFMAGFVPVYVSVEAGAELTGAATLSIKCGDSQIQTEGGVGSFSGKIYLTARAGLGVENLIDVNVSGTGACNYTWKPKDDYTKVWLNAYLELEANCFGWHADIWKSPEATYTVYESPGGVSAMSEEMLTGNMTAQLYNADFYTVMDRSYLNQEAGAQTRLFSIEGTDTFVQPSVYPGAEPKLFRVNDKFYLFWLQDIPSRSAENRAAVVYASSADGANFTAPKQLVPESENQTHDNGIDVYVDNGKIYVCWQDAAETFASGASLNEVAKSQKISYAVVDASTGDVLSNETVTDTAGCYLHPKIYVNSGQVQIAWVQNSMTSASGLWGADNQESLQKYDAAKGEIETFSIGGGSKKIVSMDGAVGNSQAGVVYALDTDGDMQTISDRMIYFDTRLGAVGSQTALTSGVGMNGNPVAENGKIYWYANGNISYTTVGSTAVQQIYEEERPDISSNFHVLSEGERTEIIWDAIEYETEKVALYGIRSSGEGQWTRPYIIEQTDSEMTGMLSGSLYNGIPYIAYMHITNQEDGSKNRSLCVAQKKIIMDLALNYAGYDYEDFKPGQALPITVELTNKGNTAVENVEIKVDGISLGMESVNLGAGETGTFVLNQYTVPSNISDYSEHTFTVTIASESNTSDNDYQIGIGYTDVKVLCSQRLQDESTWLDISVLNDSAIASDTTLNIRADKEDGEILYTEELGKIDGEKGISMTVNLQQYEDSCCTYFVEAVTGTEDVIEGNNIVFVYTGFGTDIPGGRLVPDPRFYTVSFRSNGGSEVESQQIEESRSAMEPPIPSREGYRFIGWYLNGEPYNFYLPITEDITLEAVWEGQSVLAAPSASFPTGSEVEVGTKIVLTCAASGAEIYYTLDGTTPDRSSTLYREPIVVLGDTTIMAVAVKEGYQDSPVVTFVYHTVNPQPDVCMVVFQSNGGTQVDSQEVRAGETATRPADPVREGYRFIGWYLDGELYDFTLPVTGNIRLEAVWKAFDTLDMPVSNIASGKAVPEGTKIILSTDQPGAKIYYTLDDTQPTSASLLYNKPIVITEDTVIRAIAVRKGCQNSPVVTFRYTISVKKDDLGEILPEDFPEGGVDAIPAGLWIAGVDEKGYIYTGKAIKPEVRVYDNRTLLLPNKDYSISYKNNTKVNDGSAANKAPTIVVTGKGNYSGKETENFKIVAKDIAAKDISVEDITINYNKKVQNAVPTILWNGKKLNKKTDYTVEYPDRLENANAYKNPGTYTILVKGKGCYSGERNVSLLITESKLMSKVNVSKITAQSYTGEEITAEVMDKTPVVKSGRNLLREGVHYTVSYEDNVEIGTATMILIGTGKETAEGTYAGRKKVTFKITGGDIKKATVTGIPKNMVYTGSAINEVSLGWGSSIKLSVKGKNKETKVLTENLDYTVEYKKNTECGTAQIIFTGINGYSGILKKNFKITAYNIQTDTERLLSAVIEGQSVYAKGGSKPEPVVKFGSTLLEKGKDYTLSYKYNGAVNDRKNDGKVPVVVIKGKGNFEGSVTLSYTIVKQDIGNLKAVVSDKMYQNKKNAYKVVPKVIDLDGKALKAGTDYEKNYSYSYGADTVLADGTVRRKGEEIGLDDILPANTIVNVTVTGKGNYSGSLNGQYRVTVASVSKAKVTVNTQIYSGNEIILDKSQIVVKVGKDTLLSEDYEILEDSYKNNVKKGTASVTIKGTGNYGGTKVIKFKIRAKSMLWWWR